jgi:hypothetical protein
LAGEHLWLRKGKQKDNAKAKQQNGAKGKAPIARHANRFVQAEKIYRWFLQVLDGLFVTV